MHNDYPKIRFILSQTSHAGNIGATARAIKVMGFNELYVVNPKCDAFANQAYAMAANATDVWQKMQVVNSLDESLKNCHFVFGTSARKRSFQRSTMSEKEAAKLISSVQQHNIDSLFGNEQSGLSNQELDRCQHQIVIPTNNYYSSLNLAQAVQIICYELSVAINTTSLKLKKTKKNADLATVNEVERLYLHLEDIIKQTGFYKEQHPKKMATRLRQLLHRSHLDKHDVNLLRGIFNSIIYSLGFMQN